MTTEAVADSFVKVVVHAADNTFVEDHFIGWLMGVHPEDYLTLPECTQAFPAKYRTPYAESLLAELCIGGVPKRVINNLRSAYAATLHELYTDTTLPPAPNKDEAAAMADQHQIWNVSLQISVLACLADQWKNAKTKSKKARDQEYVKVLHTLGDYLDYALSLYALECLAEAGQAIGNGQKIAVTFYWKDRRGTCSLYLSVYE